MDASSKYLEIKDYDDIKDKDACSLTKSKHFNQEILPNSLNVSTISLTLQLNTIVFLKNISQYMTINEDNICSIDFEGNNRTLIEKKRNKKKKSHNFYNSITLEIMVRPGKVINFKLFKNGGVQIAGCKNIVEGNIAINKLIKKLSEKVGIEEDGKMKEIPFTEKDISITDVKINLINVNFKLDFNINRELLYQILLNEGIECYYEKCKHAGVCVKFVPPEKEKPISIFIFESGSIVITGSKNENHILTGYNHVIDLIMTNKKKITKIPSALLLSNTLTEKYGKYMMY
jgi:TATA-box binding protein (TBP) (component of TFIID and TFIIIB)